MPKPDSIESYLAAFRAALQKYVPNDQDRLDRILAETEDHLNEAAYRSQEAGLAPAEAERTAIEQFGAPEAVARRFGIELAPQPLLGSLLLRYYVYLATLAGVILIAVGIPLIAAGVLFLFESVDFQQEPPQVSTEQCAELQYSPQECAALETRIAEVLPVSLQLLFVRLLLIGGGLVSLAGALIWGVHAFVRRRVLGAGEDRSLPGRTYRVLGTLLFGLATLALLPTGVEQIISSPSAWAGFWLSAGLVWGFFFVMYARSIRGLKLPLIQSR